MSSSGITTLATKTVGRKKTGMIRLFDEYFQEVVKDNYGS